MFKPCQTCAFDWSNDGYALEVDLYASDTAEDMDLYCPQCGEHLHRSAQRSNLGVVSQQQSGRIELRQWSDMSGVGPVRLVDAAGKSIPVLYPADVLFTAVPDFLDADGQIRTPDLPVRPDASQWID